MFSLWHQVSKCLGFTVSPQSTTMESSKFLVRKYEYFIFLVSIMEAPILHAVVKTGLREKFSWKLSINQIFSLSVNYQGKMYLQVYMFKIFAVKKVNILVYAIYLVIAHDSYFLGIVFADINIGPWHFYP